MPSRLVIAITSAVMAISLLVAITAMPFEQSRQPRKWVLRATHAEAFDIANASNPTAYETKSPTKQ